MEVRRVIHRRIRHESPGSSIVADVNAVIAANIGSGGKSKTTTTEARGGSMNNSEERGGRDAPSEERAEERVGQGTSGRGAPIDEDVAGELNAALPEDEPDDETEDGDGDGSARAA